MSQKVIIHVVKKQTTENDAVNCVESIRKLEDDVCFVFPPNLQIENHHKGLFKIPVVKNAVKSLTKIGYYRNLNILLDKELTELYMDDQRNFVFKEIYLEEGEIPKKTATASAGNITETSLMELFKILKDRELTNECKLINVEKKFSIEKFDGKQRAADWLEVFERECSRFMITVDEEKIKCLKFFLKDSAQDWYQSAMMKLPDNEWQKWSESFLAVFSNKGWSKVRYAYAFKYISGALVDYALKKERLILEVERKMTVASRINLIVIGLPIAIQDKLDQEEIKSTDELMNQLGKFEYCSSTFKESNTKSDQKLRAQQPVQKKPCYICESLKLPGRFHPVGKCYNKDRNVPRRVNVNEVSNEELEDLAKLELDVEKN